MNKKRLLVFVLLLIVLVSLGYIYYSTKNNVVNNNQSTTIPAVTTTTTTPSTPTYIPGASYNDGDSTYIFKETRTMPYNIKLDVFYQKGDSPNNEVALLEPNTFNTGYIDDTQDSEGFTLLSAFNTSHNVSIVSTNIGHATLATYTLKPNAYNANETIFNIVNEYKQEAGKGSSNSTFPSVLLSFIPKENFGTTGWSSFNTDRYGTSGFAYPPDWTLKNFEGSTMCNSSDPNSDVVDTCTTKQPNVGIFPQNSTNSNDAIFYANPQDMIHATASTLCKNWTIQSKNTVTRRACGQQDAGYFIVYTLSSNPDILNLFDKTISKDINN